MEENGIRSKNARLVYHNCCRRNCRLLLIVPLPQATHLAPGIDTCSTEPFHFRLAPIFASGNSWSDICRLWRRLCFGCASLALAYRWAKAGQMGHTRSGGDVDRNVDNGFCTASKVRRGCAKVSTFGARFPFNRSRRERDTLSIMLRSRLRYLSSWTTRK